MPLRDYRRAGHAVKKALRDRCPLRAHDPVRTTIDLLGRNYFNLRPTYNY